MGTQFPLLRAGLARLRRPRPASPAKALAERKRHLEHLLTDEGMSRTQARRVVAEFYSAGGSDAGLQ